MFAFRLASKLGIWNVDEFLANIGSRQLREWYAYYQLDPWGEERADWRAGMIGSTIANYAPNRKRGSKVFKVGDFMTKFKRNKKQTQKQIQNRLMAYFGVRSMMDVK